MTVPGDFNCSSQWKNVAMKKILAACIQGYDHSNICSNCLKQKQSIGSTVKLTCVNYSCKFYLI